MNVNMGNQNGIGQGFANLAKVFAPNSSDLIAADVARQRVAADRNNAETSRMNAVTARNKDNRDAEVHGNLMGFSDVLANLGPTLNTPEGRAQFLGEFLKTGLQPTPANMVGYLTAIDVNNIPSSDLSTVLAGTGTAWANTPEGSREVQNATTERAEIAAQNKSNNPHAVSSIDLQRIGPRIATAIESIAEVEPTREAVDLVAARASEIFQQTNNWSTAIQEAVKSFNYETSGYGWFNAMPNKFTVEPNGYTPSTGSGTPPANAATPAPQPQYNEGDTATNSNGEKLQFTNGQWVAVQ